MLLKKSFLIALLLWSFDTNGKTSKILKLSCEYSPNLIKKESKNTSLADNKEINTSVICKSFGCKDKVEIIMNDKHNGEIEYRLRNLWFDHQGILLDDFLMTENKITIKTFVSQAYFLDSYKIDRTTGKTERTIYRFDDPEFFYNLKKLEKNESTDRPLFNKNGRLSLKTLKSFSLEPWEIFYFEGKCLEGTGI